MAQEISICSKSTERDYPSYSVGCVYTDDSLPWVLIALTLFRPCTYVIIRVFVPGNTPYLPPSTSLWWSWRTAPASILLRFLWNPGECLKESKCSINAWRGCGKYVRCGRLGSGYMALWNPGRRNWTWPITRQKEPFRVFEQRVIGKSYFSSAAGHQSGNLAEAVARGDKHRE